MAEALLLILQSISQLSLQFKGQREILVRVTLEYLRENNNSNMSNNSDTVYNAPADLKPKVWKRFGYLDKVCPCVSSVQSSGSMTNLASVDANDSNVTASTSKNTQGNDMDVKDFSQPQLDEVITASTACFIVKDLRPHSEVQSDGCGDMVLQTIPLLF